MEESIEISPKIQKIRLNELIDETKKFTFLPPQKSHIISVFEFEADIVWTLSVTSVSLLCLPVLSSSDTKN